MKQFKKMLLMMMCVCVMLGCVACGSNDDADNGANQSNTTLDDANDNTMNDAIDGTDNANGKGDGVVGELGDDIEQGVDDIGNGVEDALDGNDNVDNTGDVGNNGAENKDVPKDEKNR